MNPIFKPLYLSMLSELCYNLPMDLSEKKKISNCFWVSNKYWNKILSSPDKLEFQNDDAEIDFYRNIKPKFTCYQQYFILLYESLMFLPVDPEHAMKFWENEIKFQQGFFKKHRTFINYYCSGESCHDKAYFLHKNTSLQRLASCAIYDINMDFCSSYDHIVRSFLAHKMFAVFAWEMIKSLVEFRSFSFVRVPELIVRIKISK